MGLKTDERLHTRQGRGSIAPRQGTFFGVPIGDLGWFASLLMGTATGFAAFFAATFVGIVFIMIHNSYGRSQMDYSYSYMRLGLPFGLLVLVLSLGFLGTMWFRRVFRRA